MHTPPRSRPDSGGPRGIPPDDLVYVAGHTGLVGSAIVRALRSAGHERFVLRTSRELDLTDQAAVRAFFAAERPRRVVLAAAKVGGIHANNTQRADFIYNNLAIQTHVIDAAHRTGVRRLLFLGSSCIYPRLCAQPMREEMLMTGPLEPTNEPYAVAKLAGIRMCEAYNHQHGTDFVSAIPTNTYGPHDHFDLDTSHVLPALLRKVHEAHLAGEDAVSIWGTGTARREFLHVDDLARACVLLLGADGYRDPVNVGSGTEVTIRELADVIVRVVGFRGRLEFDPSRPDGMPRKLLNSQRILDLGWRPTVALEEGIRSMYQWYVAARK